MIQSKHIIAGLVLIVIIYNLFKNNEVPDKIFKQDVNLGLWAVLAILALFFAFFSVYFTNNLNDIQGQNKYNIQVLNNITTEINWYKQKVEDVFSSKKRIEEAKNDLEDKYQIIRDDNDRISSQIRSNCAS